MKILVLGDYFSSEQPPPTIGDRLAEILQSCDQTIVNFEGPIRQSQSVRPEFKSGPNQHQSAEGLRYLANRGVTGISLANNHSYDYGRDGLESTVREARRFGMSVAGLSGIEGPVPIECVSGGVRAVILAFAEEEWCGDRDIFPRISIFDPIDVARAVWTEREKGADAVIVILHGNNEYASFPSPGLVKAARFIIECGAAAVMVHHAHTISGAEMYKECPIMYGLGNFQFAKPSAKASWFEGIGALLDITKSSDGGTSVSAIAVPMRMCALTYHVDVAEGDTRNEIMREFSARGVVISSEQSLRAAFDDFVRNNSFLFNEMLNPFASSPRLLRVLGRIWVTQVLLRGRRFAILLNSFRCRSHREALIRYLEQRL